MSNVRFVGLDVHKDSIVIAIADAGDAPAEVFSRILWDEHQLLKTLRKLGPLTSLRVCYEAGPTGYGLQRFLAAAGVDCIVVAPSLIPETNSRVKTDRRDACKLARFLRSGDLTSIWIPDEQTEALRDLERARDDARLAERRIKQQLLKFLLRHSRVFTAGKTLWTKTHWAWIRRQKFEHEAQSRVLADAIQTATQAADRIARLNQDIHECVQEWALAPLVQNLQSLHGVRELTATVIAAEIGDFQRFSSAGKLMAFVGLIPSEHSSGASRRQGGITKSGNRHVRRLLIEAAWQYYHAPAQASAALMTRREGLPENIVVIAENALRRLRKKSRMMQRNRKSAKKIVAALARELTGFIWAIGQATNSTQQHQRCRSTQTT